MSIRKLLPVIVIIVFLVVIVAALEWVGGVAPNPFAPQETQTITQSFNDNDFVGALSEVDSRLSRNSNDADLLVQKASILAQEGSLLFKEREYGEQAVQLAQQALQINPKSDEAWRIIGYANEIMQDYSAAHDAYQRSLALDPNNALTISQEAHAFDLQGDLQNAEAGYRKALLIDPGLDQATMGLGRLDFNEGRLSDALVYFQKAASNSPNVRIRAEAYYSAGVIQDTLGDEVSAESSMRQSTAEDPTYALGWTGLGQVLFSQAMASSSGATLEMRNSQIAEAMGYFEKAIGINPNQSQASYVLGVDLGVLGQTKPALQILQEAEKAVPNDITLDPSGKTRMLGQIGSALSVLRSGAKQ